MNAIAAARSDLTRWAASAVVVLGLHALGAATLLAWHDPIGMSDESSAIFVDLAPYAPPSESTEDIAPGPVQQAAAAPLEKVEPESEPKPAEKVEPKVELKPEEKVDVPPAPVPPVAAVPLPLPVTPPEPEAQPSQMPPAPATTAPPRQQSASAAEANAWHKGIFAQIQRHKAYPAAARARRENGVVQLAFSIDRDGRVVSSRVAAASGFAALDQAALETIQKAQPFPPPPADLPGDLFSFTVPVAYSIR
jgi:periplasmic protein TonB